MCKSDLLAQIQRVQGAFSPGVPLQNCDLFAGRRDQLDAIARVVAQRGRHALVFGERGVGKTSLVAVLPHWAEYIGLHIGRLVRVNADPTDSFSSIWHRVIKDVYRTVEVGGLGFLPESELQQWPVSGMTVEKLCPDDIRCLLSLADPELVVVIDEIDQIRDKDTLRLLAHTVKALADHNVAATLILAGVAHAASELIQEHPSVDRSLVQIQVPRMSGDELRQVLALCSDRCGVSFQAPVSDRIAYYSYGLPHYVHLLGLHAALCAVKNGRNEVRYTDLNLAARAAVQQGQFGLETCYWAAVNASRSPYREKVIVACALAGAGAGGVFDVSGVRRQLLDLFSEEPSDTLIRRHLRALCDPTAGAILRTHAAGGAGAYRFTDPLMQPYIAFHAIGSGIVDPFSFPDDDWGL